MPLHSDYFVVYADVLGFRDLVLADETRSTAYLDHRKYLHEPPLGAARTGSLLQHRFKTFHATLHKALETVRWTGEVTALVFSDSLFVAATEWHNCALFCQRFVRSCVILDLPVRVGVGFGSFIANSFVSESMPSLRVVTTQFLGTGVVHAVDAEKAIKGIRIALHPATVAALKSVNPRTPRCLSLPWEQVGPNAAHEWSYVGISVPSEREDDGGLLHETFTHWGDILQPASAEALMSHVTNMRDTASNDRTVQAHYTDTLDALRRMAQARDIAEREHS